MYFSFLVITALLKKKKNKTIPEPFIMHIVGQAFPNLFLGTPENFRGP